ncbi:YtcA family lipoprotein [Burkholderia sp. THE68]|uniref:YtcA family lipoprotein n=1 Tax=Burkholderia sp. THE68 TaxID=758782 RepID=UPI001E5873D3|nr:YtcA family lipoprotein [Burkholderia sp. THE68]
MNRLLLLPLPSLTLSACRMPPSISVLGAFFPDWLFCVVAGLVLTLIARVLAIRSGHEQTLGPPFFVLPALMLFFSLLAWLLFF